MSASVLTGNPVRDSAVQTDKSLSQPAETVFIYRVFSTTPRLDVVLVNRTLFNKTL